MLNTRRDTRIHLFRLRNEANGGFKAEPPEGLREYYEALPEFTGWSNFGIDWDVGKKDWSKAVVLEEPLDKTWSKHVAQAAKDLPKKERPVIKSKREPFQDFAEIDAVLKQD